MELLEVRDLHISYKTKEKQTLAVNGVTLHVKAGESLGIVGESGSGKSTLALGILRLLPKDSTEVKGAIHLLGQDLLHCSESEMMELRWKKLAVVFQKSMNSFSPVHKIGRQMEDIYRIHDDKASKEQIRSKIARLLDMVNLPQRVSGMYPHELSGGMLQRVSIALSLLHEPQLLILDEATTALDVITQAQILREIQRLENEMNVTRIMITHDVSVVANACKQVAVMYAGELMESGAVSEVLSHPVHPYTQGLLKSFPSLRGERTNFRGISGSLPDLSVVHPGCIFAPRCAMIKGYCTNEKPKMVNVGGDHQVACFLSGGDHNG